MRSHPETRWPTLYTLQIKNSRPFLRSLGFILRMSDVFLEGASSCPVGTSGCLAPFAG